GASGACTPHSGVLKEGVKSPGLSAGGDGGQEGLLPAEEPEDGTGPTQEAAPPAIC
ncbi:unnamed protein product, partial [Pylaiella littoralis]